MSEISSCNKKTGVRTIMHGTVVFSVFAVIRSVNKPIYEFTDDKVFTGVNTVLPVVQSEKVFLSHGKILS